MKIKVMNCLDGNGFAFGSNALAACDIKTANSKQQSLWEVKKFHASYGTQRLITVLTKACQWKLS